MYFHVFLVVIEIQDLHVLEFLYVTLLQSLVTLVTIMLSSFKYITSTFLLIDQFLALCHGDSRHDDLSAVDVQVLILHVQRVKL